MHLPRTAWPGSGWPSGSESFTPEVRMSDTHFLFSKSDCTTHPCASAEAGSPDWGAPDSPLSLLHKPLGPGIVCCPWGREFAGRSELISGCMGHRAIKSLANTVGTRRSDLPSGPRATGCRGTPRDQRWVKGG